MSFIEKNPDGPPHFIFSEFKEGTYFGDVDFVINKKEAEPKRNFTVKAKRDVELLVISKADLY